MQILLNALATIINMACQLYLWIVIGRVLISWVNPDPYNPIVRFLYNATDPVLNRIRRILPLQFGGIDFTPILLVVAIEVIRQALLQLLYMVGPGPGRFY